MKSLKLVALSALLAMGSTQVVAESRLSKTHKAVAAFYGATLGAVIGSAVMASPYSGLDDDTLKYLSLDGWHRGDDVAERLLVAGRSSACLLGLPLLLKEAIRSRKELCDQDRKYMEGIDYYTYGWMAGSGSSMLMSNPEICSFIQQTAYKIASVAQEVARKAYNTTPAQAVTVISEKLQRAAKYAYASAQQSKLGSAIKSHPYLAVGAAGAVVGAAAYKLYHAATVRKNEELKQPEIYVDYYGQSVPTNCVPCAQ